MALILVHVTNFLERFYLNIHVCDVKRGGGGGGVDLVSK